MFYTFHTNEWNGSGGKPSTFKKYVIYYLFNIIFILYKYIFWKSPLYAFNNILHFCKQFQTQSLDEIRQPVLAFLCPPTSKIRYISYMAKTGFNIYKVIPLKSSNLNTAILYIHGGGLISGDFAGYKGFCEDLANNTNTPVFFPAYHFAPEYSVQIAINDIIETYKILLDYKTFKQIYIIADSGGAVLALLAIYKLLYMNIQLPTKCILLSPVTDLTCSGASFWHNYKADVALDADVTKWAFTIAGAGTPRKYSPVFYTFPKCTSNIEFIIMVGKCEILLDDSTRMTAALRDAGYTVLLYETPNVFHSWPLFWKYFPEGGRAFRRVVDAVKGGNTSCERRITNPAVRDTNLI